MRVIAGYLGGRIFASPHTAKTHPMGDKIRGALFNILGDLEGLTILDAFAGSGALSFEAISRGAAKALAIEIDRAAQRTIAENIEVLAIGEKVKLIKSSVSAWLQTNPDATFDIVLCDPPYDDLQPSLINQLTQRVKPNGLFVLSWPGSTDVPTFNLMKLLDKRDYGDSTLVFYRHIQ